MKNKLYYKGELLSEFEYQNGKVYVDKTQNIPKKCYWDDFTKKPYKTNGCEYGKSEHTWEIICQSTELNIEGVPYVEFLDNEVEELSLKHTNNIMFQEPDLRIQSNISFIKGYQAHSKTHSLSDDEVIQFKIWWLNQDIEWFDNIEGIDIYKNKKGKKFSDKELLQLFKDQQSKSWEVVIRTINQDYRFDVGQRQEIQTHTKEGKQFLTIKQIKP